MVTAKNVRDGFLDLGRIDWVTQDTAARCWRRCRPQQDDVLMVCVGATTGRVCRLSSPTDMVLVRSVALLRPNQDVVLSRYLEYALKTGDMQTQIWNEVRQAAQPGLYLNRMKTLTLPVPSLQAQSRLVTRLDSLVLQLSELSDKAEASSDLLAAVVKSALTASLRPVQP